MLLNKILAKFNLVFGILVAFASVTSAAILINTHRAKLTSSGSTLPHLSGGGGSSSNEGSKSHGSTKGSPYYNISGRGSGKPTALPELISSNPFPFAPRPFDDYPLSVAPSMFPDFSDFAYCPKALIAELPTLTSPAQTNPLYPVDFETPALAVTRLNEQAADASTEESTTPITSAAPNKIEIEQSIPTPQIPIDTPPVSQKPIDIESPTPQSIQLEAQPETALKKPKLVEIAEFIMPSQRDEFFVEIVNPTFEKNFENVTAQTPDTPLKTNKTKVKPDIFRDVKPPLRRSQSTERLPELLLQNQNDADEYAGLYEDLIEKMAALNLGQDAQEELQLPEQFSDGSVFGMSEFSEGSPASMSEFSSIYVPSTPVKGPLEDLTPPSSVPFGEAYSPTHSISLSTESLLSPSDRESQPSPSQASAIKGSLESLTSPSSFTFGEAYSPTHSLSLSTESLLSPSDKKSQPSPLQASAMKGSLEDLTPPSSFSFNLGNSPTQSRSLSTESLLSPSDKESQPSPSQTSDLEELLAELGKLDDFRFDESLSSGTPSSFDYSGLSDSELEASSFSSPSFSGIAKAYQELFKDETPTRLGQPYGGSLIISKPLPLPSNYSHPFPTLCDGISPEDEAWLASEDDYAQKLTSSLDESEETLSQTESYASSESEEDEFEDMSLSASEYDSEEEIDEFGFPIPSEEHVVMLQEVHSKFRVFFTQRESEKAHQRVAQSMMSYGVFPELLQTVEKIEHHTPAPASNEDIQIEAPAVATVSPISKALIVSPYSQAMARYALFGERSALYSPPYPASPLSPPSRNPFIINGINISKGTMLPHEVLWCGAMAANGVVKGALLSLANGMSSALTQGINYSLRPNHNPILPHWAFQFPELTIERNPMLLGINAALRTYQKEPFGAKWWEAAANPFSLLAKKSLAQLGAEDAIKHVQSQSNPEKKPDTPSPIKAAKRTLASAFDGSASTSASKRHTPMRDQLMTAATLVAREVGEFASPVKTPSSRRYQQAAGSELAGAPMISHPLMASENAENSPPAASSSQAKPSRLVRSVKGNVGISALPSSSSNAKPPKASLLARWLGRALPNQTKPAKPINVEMIPLGPDENCENQSPVNPPSPSKSRSGDGKNFQDQGGSPSRRNKKRRGFGSPHGNDVENLANMVPV